MIVAVAKDLQSDFYPKFSDFFIKLVNLLQTRDPEITEWTFTTLAYLYKSLWRLLIKDITNVYGLLAPLLASNQPEHVQQFATESFAFIGRKVSDHAGFVGLIFAKLRENPDDSLGVGQLLFQIIKGVKNQFHTSLEVFVPLYFKSVSCIKEGVNDDATFQAVNHCFLLMARHTSQLHCSRVWKLLLVIFNSFDHVLKLKAFENYVMTFQAAVNDTLQSPGVLGLLILFQQWVDYKEGELVVDSLAVSNTIVSLLKYEGLGIEEQKTVSLTVAALMKSPKVRLPIEQTARLGQLAYAHHWNPQLVLDFTLHVSSHGFFESHLLPHYITYCHSLCQKDKNTHDILLKNLASLIAVKGSLPKSGKDIGSFKIYPIEFTFAMRKSSNANSVPHLIQSILEGNLDTMISEEFHMYTNALVCLPNIRPIESTKAIKILKNIIKEIANTLENLNDEEPQTKRVKTSRPVDFFERLGLILSLAILGLRHFSTNLKGDLPWQTVKSAFLNEDMSKNIFYLRAADFYLTSLQEIGDEDTFSLEILGQVYDVIGQNLGSPYHEVTF